MGDFLEGEHVFLKMDTPNGEIYWPCAIKKLLPNRIVIVEIFATGKDAKTRLDLIEHGYNLSSSKVMEIARKAIPQKQTIERFIEAFKQFKDFQTFNDVQLKPEVEHFWISQTLGYF